jgi:pimeloyl-ACP methyl ester carboxylesterase
MESGHPPGQPSALPLTCRGKGPVILFIHGSAASRATWTLQLHDLDDRFTLVAFDRRIGAGLTTESHAADAAAIGRRQAGGERILVCGSSYGGVVALELALLAPELVAGLVLCEPPLPAGPLVPPQPAGFGCAFDALVATAGGELAGEMFLRSVLGSRHFEAIPGRFRRDLCGMWRQVRSDMTSLGSYRVDEARLGRIGQPVLLLGGERSPPLYGPALEVLERGLPRVRREVVRGAGHSMHIDAWRLFDRLLAEFAAEIGHGPAPPGRPPDPGC